jgi:hypothetical protein
MHTWQHARCPLNPSKYRDSPEGPAWLATQRGPGRRRHASASGHLLPICPWAARAARVCPLQPAFPAPACPPRSWPGPGPRLAAALPCSKPLLPLLQFACADAGRALWRTSTWQRRRLQRRPCRWMWEPRRQQQQQQQQAQAAGSSRQQQAAATAGSSGGGGGGGGGGTGSLAAAGIVSAAGECWGEGCAQQSTSAPRPRPSLPRPRARSLSLSLCPPPLGWMCR